ncbi:MAG: hypothetical protein PVF27_03295, partial [Gemmatimonadales bacterium]
MNTRAERLLRTAGLVLGIVLVVARPALGQDPRLERLPEEARAEVEALVQAARADRLPTEPLIDRALEGASKGADSRLIVAAVRSLASELATAREALGRQSDSAELVAGASALHAGAA